MTNLRVRWDRVTALLSTFLVGIYVGHANALPWYATVVLMAICCTGTWAVMWRD